MGRDGLGCKIGLVRLLAEDWGTTSFDVAGSSG